MYKRQDPYNKYGETPTAKKFNVTKDDVEVEHVSGDGWRITREGVHTALLKLKLLDSDRSDTPVGSGVNGSLWITNDSQHWFIHVKTQTDDESNISYIFDPNCSIRVGPQNWTGGSDDDYAYFDSNGTTSSGFQVLNNTYKVYVYGDLKSNLDYPPQGATAGSGDEVVINVSVPTDCVGEGLQPDAEVHVYARRNQTGPEEWAECAPVIGDGTGNFSCVLNTSVPSIWAGGMYDLRVDALNTSLPYYYSNSTIYPQWITLINTPPNQTMANDTATVSPSEDGWGANFSFSVQVDDLQNDNVTCTLYTYNGSVWIERGNNTVIGGHGICMVNVSPYLGNGFQWWDIGTDNEFKFKIEDGTPENTYYTINKSGPNLTVDAITLYYIWGDYSAGEGGIVNRSDNNPVNNTTSLVSVSYTHLTLPTKA